MGNRKSLLGQTFSRLTVVEDAGVNTQYDALSLVQCICGVRKIVRNRDLLSGTTKSCGCLHRENAAKMGREYWKDKPRIGKRKPISTGNPVGRPPVAADIKDAVVDMVRQGIPYRKIAKQLPVTIGSISNIAKEYGITPITTSGRKAKEVI